MYLYGPDGTPIYHFIGSSTNEQAGSGGVSVACSSDFVVPSHDWKNDSAAGASAVTWIDGSSWLSGIVSTRNSFVGTAANEHVGAAIVVPTNRSWFRMSHPS